MSNNSDPLFDRCGKLETPPLKNLVLEKLAEIERDHQVRILYACESGSRAWGFASANSDWDVRFIYSHPLPWYVTVAERRDVIELPIEGDLDINGWDLRKTLKLLVKSNPVLAEWFGSPIVYRQDDLFTTQMRALISRLLNPPALFHHYLHMARGNFREYLQRDEVWLKKYLYVLRPILACRWIEQHADQPPPVEFARLLAATVNSPDLLVEIETLLRKKMAGNELQSGPRLPNLHAFIDSELARLSEVSPPPRAAVDFEVIDRFLHAQLCIA